MSRRPRGVTALSLLFFAGAVMAALAAVSIADPDGPLESLWEMKPAAQETMLRIPVVAIAVLSIVFVACGAAAIGSWRGARWGYRIAAALLAVNFVGDLLNATIGREPRAWIGVPITGLLLFYLSRPEVRRFFGGGS